VKTSAFKIVAILFGAVYGLAFYYDLALFRYYPETNRFHWQTHPDAGPVILWYGWLATAGLVSTAIALVVPRSISDRIPPTWVWLAPALTTLAMLFYEKRWFV
jgi:hypothetical protein